jgi:hypothetical protein
MTGNLLGSLLKGDFDLIGLFQTLLDQFVWHAIGTQRCPSSVPVELGPVLCLEEIRHCLELYFFLLCKTHFFDCISTTSLCWKLITANYYDLPAKGYFNSKNAIVGVIIVKNALVGEQIRGWYSVLKSRC